MKISVDKFPGIVNIAVLIGIFALYAFTGFVTAKIVLHVADREVFGTVLIYTAAIILGISAAFLVSLPNFVFNLLQRVMTFGLAAVFGFRIANYETPPRRGPKSRDVAYFVFNDEEGIRYFLGVGMLGHMSSIDYFNEDELATLKAGKTLAY
jgi:hypothetical protein